jgi:hypothetical protein
LPLSLLATGTGGFVLQNGADHIQIIGTPSEVNSYFGDALLTDAISIGAITSPLFKELVDATQLKNIAKLLDITTSIAEQGVINEAKVTGALIDIKDINNKFKGLTPPVAFLEVGVSAVSYAIQSLINLIPGNGPAPSYQEFKEKLEKILAGELLFTFVVKPLGGLPHLITSDGVIYDLHAVGDFVLAISTSASNNFQVQGRFEPYNGSSSVSATAQVAAAVGSDRVTFDAHRPETVWINGFAVVLTPGATVTLAAGQAPLA